MIIRRSNLQVFFFYLRLAAGTSMLYLHQWFYRLNLVACSPHGQDVSR